MSDKGVCLILRVFIVLISTVSKAWLGQFQKATVAFSNLASSYLAPARAHHARCSSACTATRMPRCSSSCSSGVAAATVPWTSVVAWTMGSWPKAWKATARGRQRCPGELERWERGSFWLRSRRFGRPTQVKEEVFLVFPLFS